MRISVNLATRPFVELRPFFLRLRILMGVLAAVGIAAIVVAHIEQKKLDVATRQMDLLKARTTLAQMEKRNNEQRMRQPANAEVLERAHFLNALFLRKSFSWTAVMMDLETVLPVGVQVTSIEPSVTADGDVLIRLRVSGERDKAVQLVRNLERSKRFLQPRLTGEAVQAKEALAAAQAAGNPNAPAGVEFEILANYNPLPEGEAFVKVEKKAEAKKAGKGVAAPAKGYGVVLKPYAATHPAAGAKVAPGKPKPKGARP
jgi:type IV pilus assembly protein PilN